MRLPINGDRLVAIRKEGKAPKRPVVVLFTNGRLTAGNLQLIAKPGQQYDWRVLRGLSVIVIIDNGQGSLLDLSPIVKEALFGECSVFHISQARGAWAYTAIGERNGIPFFDPVRLSFIDWCSWQNERFIAKFGYAAASRHQKF